MFFAMVPVTKALPWAIQLVGVGSVSIEIDLGQCLS